MNKKYTAILLALLVVAAEASNVVEKTNLLPKLLNKSILQARLVLSTLPYQLLLLLLIGRLKWDGLGLSADVNDYVDNTIAMIVPFIKEHGLDPMPLPDVEEGFEVRPVLITYSAWLRIHDGYMSGLVNVERSGDQMVYFFAKMLRIRLKLQFTNLDFVYKYLVKVMRIGPTGGIVGSLNRFIINVDLLFDFNNDEIQLQEFSLTDIGRLRVRLTGNILTDWLVNPVIGVFVRIFDTIIIKVVEANIRSAIQDAITHINTNVKDIINIIESYNH